MAKKHSKSGWIILDKPSGVFSRAAGTRISKAIGVKKFGHIGTLDPMASGVLPLAIGDATKMIPYIEEREDADIKEYFFSMFFGVETTTGDITGRIIKRGGITPDAHAIVRAASRLVGDIMQTPPAFSAVHIDGRRAYEIARAGQKVDIPPRRVRIHSLELTGRNGNSWAFRVVCSRGTYVRSIAADIARMCGTIATVDMIRRVRSGPFNIKNAQKLDFLENLGNNGGDIGAYLVPADFGLADIPVLRLSHIVAGRWSHGATVQTDKNTADGTVRVYDEDIFIGIGTVRDGALMPKRIL